jgi:hypothetical protein
MAYFCQKLSRNGQDGGDINAVKIHCCHRLCHIILTYVVANVRYICCTYMCTKALCNTSQIVASTHAVNYAHTLFQYTYVHSCFTIFAYIVMSKTVRRRSAQIILSPKSQIITAIFQVAVVNRTRLNSRIPSAVDANSSTRCCASLTSIYVYA